MKQELGFSFTDGFIGYIGYDMVKVFEPILKPYMDNLEDTLNIPDLDLIRPSVILAFSHKSATLTIIQNDDKYSNIVEIIEKILKEASYPTRVKKSNPKR